MGRQKIKYSEIMALGFTETKVDDPVYFNDHGFAYCIITKDLTDKVYLDWAKETQSCLMVRTDGDCNVKATLPIRDLAHLKEIVNFFSDESI